MNHDTHRIGVCCNKNDLAINIPVHASPSEKLQVRVSNFVCPNMFLNIPVNNKTILVENGVQRSFTITPGYYNYSTFLTAFSIGLGGSYTMQSILISGVDQYQYQIRQSAFATSWTLTTSLYKPLGINKNQTINIMPMGTFVVMPNHVDFMFSRWIYIYASFVKDAFEYDQNLLNTVSTDLLQSVPVYQGFGEIIYYQGHIDESYDSSSIPSWSGFTLQFKDDDDNFLDFSGPYELELVFKHANGN